MRRVEQSNTELEVEMASEEDVESIDAEWDSGNRASTSFLGALVNSERPHRLAVFEGHIGFEGQLG